MSLKRNIIANYLGQAWTALIGLALVPTYIQYLGIEAWGLIGFMALFQAWLNLLDLGLSPTLSREMTRSQAGALNAQSIRDLLRSFELIYSVIAFIILCLFWLIAPWLANNWLTSTLLNPASIRNAISVMGLVLATRMVEQVYRGAILGLQHQVWLNSMQSFLATIRWVGVLGVLAYVSSTIEAFFLWQGLISIISALILAIKTYRLLPIGMRAARFDLVAVLRVRRFAGGIALTTLLALLLTQVDKLLLSKLVSLEDFGYYTLAGSVAGALGFLVSPIATAVSPRLTELVAKSQPELLIDTFHRASQWLAVLLIPVALAIVLFSEPLLYVWTGNVNLARLVAPLLALIALGTLLNGFMHIPYMVQLAHGWTGFAVRMNTVAVCLEVPFLLWVVPRFGSIGAAWVWLTLNAGYLLIGTHFMHRRLIPGEKWIWYKNAVFKPLIFGAIAMFLLRYTITLPDSRVSMALVLGGIIVLDMMIVLYIVPAPRIFLQNKFKTLLFHI
ncbi:oligosaccharide flippase family protein [Polynucleobacter paneuropaeus]|nr:oligosaccharide flippase family protein [Polynucleobacter paneuropaeus]